MKTTLHKLTQRAALFGLDARIALVAMGVVAMSIGVITINQVSENKVYRTTEHIQAMRDAIYFLLDEMPAIYSAPGVFTNPAQDFDFLRDSNEEGTDPWNELYVITRIDVNKSLQGESVPVLFFTIVSGGPDGVVNSATITSEADYAAWWPAGDDIGLKFSTLARAKKTQDENKKRLAELATLLKRYERTNFEALRTFCDVPANQLSATCDFDSSASYTIDEEFQANLYPRLSGETQALKYYVATTYTSGDPTSMGNLMILLGAPYQYNYDKMGRVLKYHSNVTGSARGPFVARFYY